MSAAGAGLAESSPRGSWGPATKLVLADSNGEALGLGAVNAMLNDIPSSQTVLSDVLCGVEDAPDVVIANAPYLIDDGTRLYRHVLYSGTPIIAGRDPFFEISAFLAATTYPSVQL